MKRILLTFLCAAIEIASADIVIDDFESDAVPWSVKGQGLQFQTTGESAQVKEGKVAGRLAVDYDKPFSSTVKWNLPDLSDVSPSAGSLTFWLFGDGSSAKLQLSFFAEDGGVFSNEKAVDWSGWEEVTIPLNQFSFNPFAGGGEGASQTIEPSQIKHFAIGIYSGLRSGDARHEFFVDSIRLSP